MKRNEMIDVLNSPQGKNWDIVIIGGGASGLGAALDSVTRGYKTLLIEQSDFAKGTSSRSTKLVHGGVRYLAQGDISLVLEALQERGLLRQNAPHLVRNQSFVIPNYSWWSGPFYTLGMKVYDMMAGKLGLGPSEHISKEETLEAIPNISEKELIGGVIYYDGQFDDARLAINLAQTFVENSGVAINYMKATDLVKNSEGMICGLKMLDIEENIEYQLNAKVVVNATGVFVDSILQLDDVKQPKMIKPSQGIHIVLDKSFLQGESAIMIPKTSDGRVLFAVPWHNKVVVGTTDIEVDTPSLEPRALEEEIEFILNTAGEYLKKAPKRSDVLSIFAGLRPLAAPQADDQNTKEISRSHKIMVSLSGLITITGGKWTTYRKMAEDTIDKAALVGGLPERACETKNLPIHGYLKNTDWSDYQYIYGTDKKYLKELVAQNPNWAVKLHNRLNFTQVEVIWAVRQEMARTLDDVLARRVRALFLDARAAIEMAPKVAEIMAIELNKDENWVENQINEFTELAQGYLLK